MLNINFLKAVIKIENGNDYYQVLKEEGLTENDYAIYLLQEKIEELTLSINSVNLKFGEIKRIFNKVLQNTNLANSSC